MNDKIYSMLGLAQKAGKLVSGDFTCEALIKSKKCMLVIISEDISDRSRKKFMNMCDFRNIKILTYGNKEEIGKSIGKAPRTVVAIKDANFAQRIETLISERINGGEPIA